MRWLSFALATLAGCARLLGVDNFPKLAPFTLELWVRPRLLDIGYRRLLAKEITDTTPQEGYQLTINRDDAGAWVNLLRAHAPAGNESWVRTPFPDPLVDHDYHHVVGTFDGTSLVVYVDGHANSNPAQFAIVETAASFVIGGREPAGAIFDGDLDDVAIYDHALTAARVKAHLQAR
jgi:hypothetical protein